MDNNHYNVIDISKGSLRSHGVPERYFCSYCNTRLTPLTQEDMIGGLHMHKVYDRILAKPTTSQEV
jgi:hypothetical protein